MLILLKKNEDIFNAQNFIPFFNLHRIRGVKAKDFSDWIEAAEVIKKGDHLTTEGSSKIINIKAGMNTGRELD